MKRLLIMGVVMLAGCSAGVKMNGTVHFIKATDTRATQSTVILMPIECACNKWGSQTTTGSSITIPTSTDTSPITTLQLTVNNIEYADEVAVYIPKNGWIALDNSTCITIGAGSGYGNIGGQVTTLTVNVPLISGTVVPARTYLMFRFNKPDPTGRCNTYRIIALNYIRADGTMAIPASEFNFVLPSQYVPPLTDAADAAAGQVLWNTAQLNNPVTGKPGDPPCVSCHTSDGQDLKYFNYDPQSIIYRAMYHGLSWKQAAQIADYIHSLPASEGSVYGRPWNPPFQPGVGLTSRTDTEWAAGAGWASVLENDAQEQKYLFPDGITQASIETLASPGAKQVNPRDIPISLPLLTWDQWLPVTAPENTFGATTFHSSQLYQEWVNRAQDLWVPGNNTGGGGVDNWMSLDQPLLKSINALGPSGSWRPSTAQQVYALGQWIAVHTWQIEQQHFQQYPSSKKNWYNGAPFLVSPNRLFIPMGMETGSLLGDSFIDSAWYQIQVSVDAGGNAPGGNAPVDWGYYPGVVDHLYGDGGPAQPMRLTEGFLIAMRNFDGSISSQNWGGWLPQQADNITFLMSWPPLALWKGEIPTFRSVMNALLPVWLQRANSFSPQQYYEYEGISAATEPSSYMAANWYSGLWGMLPILSQNGVNAALITQLASFGHRILPGADWAKQVPVPSN